MSTNANLSASDKLRAEFVIVNYNAGEWLPRSIASALQCSTGGITVVDNCSSDNSVALAQQAHQTPRLQWLLNQENRGFAAANNQVLASLNSEFAVLMNPDCELQAETVPRILEAFDRHPRMGLASCRILNEDGSLQATCRRRFPTPWSAFVRLLQLHRFFPNNPKFTDFDYGDAPSDGAIEFIEAVSGAFMVVRRSALEQVGLLDEAYFMHCEDLDWCKRFQLAGFDVGFISDVSVVHAKGVSSQSRPIRVLWTLHLGMNRFFDKFYQESYSFPVRYVVKVGIVASFIGRASVSLIRRFLPTGPSQ